MGSPKLNYGVLACEKLEVLPWYSGRTEATSFNWMAETEAGYYQNWLYLMYADKTDLAGWTAVCKNPGCGHTNERCSAYTSYEYFVIKDNRIYTVSSTVGLPDYYRGDAQFILMSMDPDGDNRKLAYAIERQDRSSTPRAIQSVALPYGYFYSEYVLNTDGTHTQYVYRIQEDGTQTVMKMDTGDEYIYGLGGIDVYTGLYGDRNMIIGDAYGPPTEWTKLYRLSKSELTPLDLPFDISSFRELKGCYLSGDIIRCYRQNDGYYDINISTGEEVKVADAQLKDAGAFIVLPNCILESTMAWENFEGEGVTPAEGEHKLILFDGERWRSVELPEELRIADAAQSFGVIAVTSDKIILSAYNNFTLYKTRVAPHYIIDLNADDLKLVHAYDMQR